MPQKSHQIGAVKREGRVWHLRTKTRRHRNKSDFRFLQKGNVGTRQLKR